VEDRCYEKEESPEVLVLVELEAYEEYAEAVQLAEPLARKRKKNAMARGSGGVVSIQSRTTEFRGRERGPNEHTN